MTIHISDDLTWTEKEEKDTAKDVVNMINSPKILYGKAKTALVTFMKSVPVAKKRLLLLTEKQIAMNKDHGLFTPENLKRWALDHSLTDQNLTRK